MKEVVGVNPPFSSRSGLTNMELFLFGLVLIASERNASISLPTLRWAGRVPTSDDTRLPVEYVPHVALYNVTSWHVAAEAGLLPPLTDDPPTTAFGAGVLWRRSQEHLRETLKSGAVHRPAIDGSFARFALEPSGAIADAHV